MEGKGGATGGWWGSRWWGWVNLRRPAAHNGAGTARGSLRCGAGAARGSLQLRCTRYYSAPNVGRAPLCAGTAIVCGRQTRRGQGAHAHTRTGARTLPHGPEGGAPARARTHPHPFIRMRNMLHTPDGMDPSPSPHVFVFSASWPVSRLYKPPSSCVFRRFLFPAPWPVSRAYLAYTRYTRLDLAYLACTLACISYI